MTLKWADLEIHETLGEGKAGRVFRATLGRAIGDAAPGSQVAVKRYKPSILEAPDSRRRIERELRIGLRIAHPNLVRPLALVETPDGGVALVTELYEGLTLEAFLAAGRSRGERPPVDLAFTILGQLAGALHALHAADIVHRDVKPANVILHPARGAILMDLGVGTSPDNADATTTAQFLGTIRYADPAYLGGSAAKPGSDVYSLGAIAYELIFGKQFLGGEQNWAQLTARKLSSNPTPSSVHEEASLLLLGGINAYEATRVILSWLLLSGAKSSSVIDLANISEVCAAGVWHRPFHIEGLSIRMGAPVRVSRLGATNEEYSLFAARIDCLKRLAEFFQDFNAQRLLALTWSTYGKWFKIAPGDEKEVLAAFDLGLVELVHPTGGRSAIEEHPADCFMRVAPTIHDLLRYGYLPQPDDLLQVLQEVGV